MPATGTTPRVHIAKTRSKLADKTVREYAYVRYEVWDPKKGRYQPKPLATLGRTDRLDDGRVESLGGFLKEWLKKDSALPFEALRERFKSLETSFQILCSRDFGLRFIVEQAWEELGYKEAVNELAARCGQSRIDIAIFAMVLVQLLAPQSKRSMAQWQGNEVFFPEGTELELKDLYAAMDVLEAGYESVEQKLVDRLRELGKAGCELAADTTTIGFSVRYDDDERRRIEEQRQEQGRAQRPAVVNDPPLRMRGHSKNKRNDLPQIVVEAVASEHGLVVYHDTHAGNTSDQSITPATVEALQGLGYKGVRWAADTGMNSAANRNALRAANFDFVMGEGLTRTKVVRQVLARAGRYQRHPDKPELSFKCVLAEAVEERAGAKPGPQRLYIVRHNKDEEEYTLHRIARHVRTIEAALAKGGKKAADLLKHRTYRKYVRRDGRKKNANGRAAGRVILDRTAIARMKKLAGKSVIATDCCEAHPLAEDDVYRNLFTVEAIFRQFKSTIEVGPVRHRKAERIRAHVMIAIMALNLGRWLELKAGMTVEKIKKTLINLRVQEVQMGEARYWERTNLESAQRDLFAQLGYAVPPKRFTASVVPPFPSNSR